MGHLPTSTSDKWFIYSEGPDTSGKLKVHFHRSWTGMKIATVFVVVDWKGEGAGTIVGIKWNGSSQTEGMGGFWAWIWRWWARERDFERDEMVLAVGYAFEAFCFRIFAWVGDCWFSLSFILLRNV
jgi:hypothetical protein